MGKKSRGMPQGVQSALDLGIPDLEAVREAFEKEDGEWLDQARAAMRRFALDVGRPVSADDFHFLAEHLPALAIPAGRSPSILGMLFAKAGDDLGFRAVDWKRSKRSGRHGGLLRTWVPVDQAAA